MICGAPCYLAQDLAQGTLVGVLAPYVAKSFGIYTVYPYTKQQPTKVKLFIEHLYYYQRHRDQFQ